jgi:hypothetical protein
MAPETTVASIGQTLSVRAGSSRKLLARKAPEKGSRLPSAETLEDSFPAPAAEQPEHVPSAHSSSSSGLEAAPPEMPAAPPVWSSEDEAALQALLARRKAAGYQGRGLDVSAQRLRPGTIAPNPQTIVATIVALVAGRGELSRAELLELMAVTNFPHPKARPEDKGWCQGYVAGAVRSGFLAVAPEPSAQAGEGSTPQSEPSPTEAGA